MKKLFTLIATVLITTSVFAQSPEKMSYQAVIRDSYGELVISQQIGMQISILQGSENGTVIYSESQTPISNSNGLISIEIGNGSSSDDFSAIDWSNNTYFIKTESDPTGGSTFTIIGVSQLLSVPYALHAKTAETITGNFSVNETDPVYTASDAASITATDIVNLWNLSGTNTGDQDLSTLATKTALADSTAQVRSEIPDVSSFISSEADPTFTSWDKSTGINIKESQISDLKNYLISEVDGSITNEIQTINRDGLTVTLSNGGGTYTDSVNVYTAGNGIVIENNEISVAEDTTELYIGKLYQGGIIFYLNPNGEGGLILSREDIGGADGVVWSNVQSTAIGKTAQNLFNGMQNSLAIVNQAGHTSSAAQLCLNYEVDGYDDWYLPSVMELKELGNVILTMYDVLNRIDAVMPGLDYSAGNNLRLWSSTEYYASNKARYYHAVDERTSEVDKSGKYRVRAVRKF